MIILCLVLIKIIILFAKIILNTIIILMNISYQSKYNKQNNYS